MTPRRTADGPSGLTLIELLITLTILAVAGVLVSGAFTTGLRAWQSGQKSGREELVARIVLERIASQLRAAVPALALSGREQVAAFVVKDEQLRFVTLGGAGSAPVQVSYSLESAGEGPHLVYREYPWPDKDFLKQSRPRREEQVPEVTKFEVSVEERPQGADDGGIAPAGTWDPRNLDLPGKVTIEIAVPAEGEPEPRSYRMVVPILDQTP